LIEHPALRKSHFNKKGVYFSYTQAIGTPFFLPDTSFSIQMSITVFALNSDYSGNIDGLPFIAGRISY